MSKAWSGRFTKEMDRLVEEYTSSISFDYRLYREDIMGSLAHVQMLGEKGILSLAETEAIKEGLLVVKESIEKGEVEFSLAHEDIHINIEKLLYDEIGPVAGKLHTARSRNDQVATDLHLYVRDKGEGIVKLLGEVQVVILNLAKQHIETVLPGYTHLQRAQPVSFAHHLLAYFWMLERDKERFRDSLQRNNQSPLGAGALAGTTFPIDGERVAEILGFKRVYANSMDAVSDRDFVVEFLANASILMMHLSRLAEELILWSSAEFSFIELDDAYCTGSSIMPQKKNPDVPELLRGKTGRVYGNLMGLLTVLKGLPMTYNKDLQEDKEFLFDTVDTLEASLALIGPLLQTLKVNVEVMYKACIQDYSNATELADYLAKRGLPFREAHEVTGRIVLYAIEKEKFLLDLSLEEYLGFSELFASDVYALLSPVEVVKRRANQGGTGFSEVQRQIKRAAEVIEG